VSTRRGPTPLRSTQTHVRGPTPPHLIAHGVIRMTYPSYGRPVLLNPNLWSLSQPKDFQISDA